MQQADNGNLFFPFYSEEVADSSERGHADAINELIPIHHRLLPLAGCVSPAHHAAHYHNVLLTHDLCYFFCFSYKRRNKTWSVMNPAEATRNTNRRPRCLIFKMQRQHQSRSGSACSGRSILRRQTIVISGVERCHSDFCLRNQFAPPAPVTPQLWAAGIFF